MNFIESIKTVFQKYAEFEGTATRPEYWWWTLFTVIVTAPLQLILEVLQYFMDGVPMLAIIVLPVALLSMVIGFGLLVPTLAVTVRRLRDAGYHWAFIFISLIPVAGWIALIVLLTMPSREQNAQ